MLRLKRLQLRKELGRLRVLGANGPRLGDLPGIGEDCADKGDHA